MLSVTTAGADPDQNGHHYRRDHDRARAALERREVLPLAQILDVVAKRVPGDIVELELEQEEGVWVYEIKVIAPDGRLLEVLVDAAEGTLLEHQEDH